MTPDFDVAIVGGGLNGPAMALAAAQAGLTVALIEAAPEGTARDAAFDGRGYALAHASVRMLRALGVWTDVDPKAQPILDIEVVGEHHDTAPGSLHFDHSEIDEGPMGWMLEDRHLRQALSQGVTASGGVRPYFGAKVRDIIAGPGHVDITTTAGNLTASLVIGCDGRNSTVARTAGLTRTLADYNQTAVVCAVMLDRPHKATAWQVFRAAGPLAILPLPGDRASIVWAERPDRAADLMDMAEDTFLSALSDAFEGLFEALSLDGRRYAYPLTLSLAKAMVGVRCALIGDAAHGIHPLAGQGLNQGFRDIAALADVIAAAHRRGEDIGSKGVLERYRQWRQFDASTLSLGTHAINSVFSNDNPAMKLLRGAALDAADRIPAVRRAMIREAAGLSGELPSLMAGRPV